MFVVLPNGYVQNSSLIHGVTAIFEKEGKHEFDVDYNSGCTTFTFDTEDEAKHERELLITQLPWSKE